MQKDTTRSFDFFSRLIRGFLISVCLSILFLSPMAFSADSGEIPVDMVEWALAEDALFQTSTIGALMVGVFDGELSIEQMKKYGDFGIGTVNGLDGELIALEGEFYHVRTDGVAYLLSDSDLTPFANIVKFQPEVTYFGLEGLTYEQLKKRIDDMVPTPNYVYAYKVEGTFSYMRTRSVSKQEKPYTTLTEAVQKQTEFEFTDVEGTLVGFYCPAFMNGINVPGYHFHFLTKDRTAGGHVLDCAVGAVDVFIDYKFAFKMVLPGSSDFYTADLSVEGLDDVENPKSSLRLYQQLK